MPVSFLNETDAFDAVGSNWIQGFGWAPNFGVARCVVAARIELLLMRWGQQSHLGLMDR